jgi:hypothetical protein
MESPRLIRAAAALAAIAMLAFPSLAFAQTGAGGDGIDPAWGPPENPVYSHLLVVAPRDWLSSIEPLMTWRERTSGAEPHFLALEDAYANGTGLDSAARLKDAIARAVAADGPLKALLLVGDGGVVPVRRVFVDITGSGVTSDPLNLRWSDDYYVVGSERTWDRDGDGTYGEDGEVLDEVASALAFDSPPVGRIPASNSVQVSQFVAKLLAYERSPPPGDWYRRALLAGGLMDVPNVLDNPYTPDTDGGYDPASDNAYESHKILRAALGDDWDVAWLYDYPFYEGGRWNLSADTLDRSTLVHAFDRGNAIVSMNMHGYEDSTGLAHYNGTGVTDYWWDWSTAYDWHDADRAANGGMLPWVFLAACYVGDVSLPGDRTLAHLVLNPGGGAVGMVAGNGENYKGEFEYNGSYGNWWLEREYWSFYLGAWGVSGPGAALVATKACYLDLVTGSGVPHAPLLDAYYAADYLSYNLLGDPLTNVWRDEPSRMHVDAIEDDGRRWADDGIDAMDLRILDGAGAPVPNALVDARWTGGSARTYGGTDGWYSLDVPLDAGELDIVVWRYGFLPIEVRVQRPVTDPDMELAEVRWWTAGGTLYGSPTSGEAINITAVVEFHGRYEYNQTRVRFQASYEGGPFVTLAPDVWVGIEGFRQVAAHKTWLPQHAPGRWRLRVTVDPAALPDAFASNNELEVEMSVMGAPQWVGLPQTVTLDCRGASDGALPLAPYLRDPDTPIEDLRVEATILFPPVPYKLISVGDDLVLHVRPLYRPGGSTPVRLTVTDGTFEANATVFVELLMDVPSVRLAAPGTVEARVGEVRMGTVRIEPIDGWATPDVQLVAEGAPDGFTLDTWTGTFNFTPTAAGENAVTVRALYVPGGLPGPIEVANATMLLRATDAADLPPVPVGWTKLKVAAGSTAEVRLQAVDPEGAAVTFELATPGGALHPDVSTDGLVRLDLAGAKVGDYELFMVLSDGSASANATLEVEVTPSPGGGGGTGYGPYLVLGAVAFLVAAVVWRARTLRRERAPPKV